MIWLILGLSLWVGAHFFKRALPRQRAAMGKAGKGVVAILLVASIVSMMVGYGAADFVYLYEMPLWVWHVINLLMLFAIFLLDVGQAGGVVGARMRHPMARSPGI